MELMFILFPNVAKSEQLFVMRSSKTLSLIM